jgi:hypothetical protein
MVNCALLETSAMNIRELGSNLPRLKLRIISDEDLWSLFLNHRAECSRKFWEELGNRKAAGILSKDSPFWTMSNLARYFQPQGPAQNSNLIELTREE